MNHITMNPLLYIDPQAATFVLSGILLICIFISGIFYFKAKHNEKLLLIEKGLTDNQVIKPKGNSLLKIGIIIIGLSIGLVIISALNGISADMADGIEVAIMGISGGVAMVAANRVDKKS
ncbi:DUF6249 domain-containing protein [Daejeonella sp.]|uniref:DUF6249 domain-containing protein n=1 Tax=Daejeonella sp. TaxID=2805397 RepID=UPI0030BA6BB5